MQSPSATSASTPGLPSIPWWSDISSDVLHELTLDHATAFIQQIPTCDIIVIGGGVAGLSAALSAREAGANVMLLEREPMLGYGATGRNAGILSAGINMHIVDLPLDGPEAAFWPETTQVLLSLVEASQRGELIRASLTGALSLAESKFAAKKLRRETRARNAMGLRAEMWSPSQVAEVTHGRLNTSTVIEAMWLPDEGRLHPLTLLAYLAKQARTAGVQLLGQMNVVLQEVIDVDGTSLWRVRLSDGTTLHARGLMQAVGPTIEANARIYALAFNANLPDDFPLFWDAAPYTYADFRAGNGRLTVSGGRYGRANVTGHDNRYFQRLANAAHKWLPELADQQPRSTWAVDLAVTPDMIPTIRLLDASAPGVAIEGLGALGVLPGMVLGKRAGKEIANLVGM